MEKRLIAKMEEHNKDFKSDIKKWLHENGATIHSDDTDLSSNFLQFVFDYRNVSFSKDDFLRRKRNKNVVPDYDRCCALRANQDRCSRKRKGSDLYCGTHLKGIPHGSIETKNVNKKKSIELWVEEIQGIVYYIDALNNVYSHEDIIQSVEDPRVISTWKINDKGEYQIIS